MMNFCTLFDSFYLSRGLIMYESLHKQTTDFHLYIFAFDDLCYNILINLNLKNATIISLKEFENDKLLAVKNTRSKAEYCWTCTPSTIEYVLDNYPIDNCTYIDADLYFYQSPELLFKELEVNNKSVLITEHRYTKSTALYEKNRGGRFCVQFITFNQDKASRQVLEEWKNQCLDWCYARYEDGKFGDQKYLDEWPDKYTNIHILENLGGGVAPWNIGQYYISEQYNKILGKIKKQNFAFDLIFYHFHFVRFMNNGTIDLGWHYLSGTVQKLIYLPYIKELVKKEIELKKTNPDYKPLIYPVNTKGFKNNVKNILKTVLKYNIIFQDKI